MADAHVLESGTGTMISSETERRVLRLLHRHGTLSRTELVDRMEMSTASISIAVRKLIDVGIVGETDGEATGPGRPATPVRIQRDAWSVLAVEVVSGLLRTAIVDAAGVIRALHEQRLPSPISPTEGIQCIAEVVTAMMSEHARIGTSIIGAVVSVSGVVLSDNVLLSSGLGWRDVPLADKLRRMLGIPVALINDMDARALAEFRYGSGAGYGHVLFVSIEPVGIGAGIVRDGKLYKGARGGAAELGHLVVERHGLACPCGQRGCLDVYSSENAIVARAQHLSRFRPTITEKVSEIRELQREIEWLWQEAAFNPDMHRIFEDAMDYFGIAVANLVTVLDPDIVLVGGHLPRTVGRWGLDALTSHVRRSAVQHVPGEPAVLCAELGDEAGLLGAAYAMIDEWLDEGGGT